MKKILLILSFLLLKQKIFSQMKGIASRYADKFSGRKTATGEIYRHSLLTAASNHFKLGTVVRVTNLLNGLSVIVKINDRMNRRMDRRGRIIDLSKSALKQITHNMDIVHVKVEPISI